MSEDLRLDSYFTETNLLWFAIGLAVLFIGILIFDYFKRKRRRGKHRHSRHAKPVSLGTKLMKPIRAFQEVKRALRHAYRRRTRHQRRIERVGEQMHERMRGR